MSICAIVKNNTVIDMVLWDGESEWSPADGVAVPADEYVGIGWIFQDGVFTSPDTSQPPDELSLYESEFNSLNMKFEADKVILASAYLNAILFDGVNEQQKRDEIYQKLTELNAAYDQQAADLEIKYGG